MVTPVKTAKKPCLTVVKMDKPAKTGVKVIFLTPSQRGAAAANPAKICEMSQFLHCF